MRWSSPEMPNNALVSSRAMPGAAAIVMLAAACTTSPSVVVTTSSALTPTTTPMTTAAPETTTTIATTTSSVAPTPPSTFAIIGDYGNAGPEEVAVSAMIHDLRPEYIATVGDNAYGPAGFDAVVGQYFADYIGDYTGVHGDGAGVNRFFPALGNHDYTDVGIDEYLDFFTLPGAGYASSSGNERYYDVVLGPIHWYLVNSDGREPDGITADSAQAAWLEARLAASTEPWQVVAFHHAPYGSAHHGGEEALRWPFAAWGADLVLTGHNHNYERFAVDGITYVTVGLGRTNVPLDGDPDPHSVFFYGGVDSGALFIEACDTALSAEFRTIGAGVVDTFTIGTGTCSG